MHLFVGSNFGTINITTVWFSIVEVVLWHCWLFAVKGLGFIFNSHLTFSDQISSLFKSCYYHICELCSIRTILTSKLPTATATSIVHSKLDYCNSLYHNLPKSQTNRLQVIQNSLAQDLRLPKSVTSPLFWNLYTGLKSMNTLNTNFFLLPIKLLPQLKVLICTAWSLFSPPPCYTLLICSRPLSTTYIFFSRNQQ